MGTRAIHGRMIASRLAARKGPFPAKSRSCPRSRPSIRRFERRPPWFSAVSGAAASVRGRDASRSPWERQSSRRPPVGAARRPQLDNAGTRNLGSAGGPSLGWHDATACSTWCGRGSRNRTRSDTCRSVLGSGVHSVRTRDHRFAGARHCASIHCRAQDDVQDRTRHTAGVLDRTNEPTEDR